MNATESHPVIRTALEWWRASGERTHERLERLVWHWGTAYGYSTAQISRLALDAKASVKVENAVR